MTTGNNSLDGKINDICTGIFASTLVAWIVAYHQEKDLKKRRNGLRTTLILDVTKEIISYFEIYAFWIVTEDEEYNQDRKFVEWTKLYTEKVSTRNIPWIDEEDIIKALNRIVDKLEDIIKNKIMLLENRIITNDDLIDLEKLQRLFRKGNFIKVKREDYACRHLDIFNRSIAKELSYMKEYKWLVDTKYNFDVHSLSSELERRRMNIYNNYYK